LLETDYIFNAVLPLFLPDGIDYNGYKKIMQEDIVLCGWHLMYNRSKRNRNCYLYSRI